MSAYLMNILFTSMSPELCLEFSREMDIDGNGSITDEDLNTFITRYTYFDNRKS